MVSQSPAWSWFVNEQQTVCLSLGSDIQFETPFQQKLLLEPDSEKFPFTTDDAQTYAAFRDILAKTSLNQQRQFSAAINAVVACDYLKPLAPKSWYFQKQKTNPTEIYDGDFVYATAQENGYYLVIGSEPDTSLIMLISERHQLDENRVLPSYQVMRVHNDRLCKVQNLTELSL